MKKHPAHVLQLFRPIRMTDLSFSEWVKEAIVFENGLIDCGNIEFADFLRMMWLNTPGFGGDWGKSFFGQQVDIISAVIHPGNRICSVYWMTGQAQVLAAVGHCHEAGVIIGAMEMDVPMTMLDKYVWAPVRYFVNEDPTMLNVKCQEVIQFVGPTRPQYDRCVSPFQLPPTAMQVIPLSQCTVHWSFRV